MNNSPLLYACMDNNIISTSVFRKMVLDGILTGKGVVNGEDNCNGVKYFTDRKVGERRELYYMKRKDMKKATDVLRSIGLEEYLEKQLSNSKLTKNCIGMFVAFSAPKFDDRLLTKVDVLGEENE